MKKALSLIFILVIASSLLFISCGKNESTVEAPKADETPAAPMVDLVEEAANAYFAEIEGSNIIKEDVFLEKVKAGEDMFVVDIRKADDYAAGHITGAMNAPWGPEIAARMNMIPQTGNVYVYCYSGQTAGQAIAIMRMAGIPATSVRYGFSRGISTIEGFEAAVDTEGVAFAQVAYEIDPAIQAAVDAYYGELGAAPFKNNIIAAADAAAIIEAGDDSVQFVDLRKPEDYAKGHIKGAINVPYGNGMQSSFSDLPADKKLIVNCYSGQTAGQTAAILNMLGYDSASINSGMGTAKTGSMGYANEGFDLVM